ncbi:BGLU4 [Symbiodinium microadriaticum]|nr:BGLU4 [Symbiodinium microadriaticum]CAE7939457.1 BGLU4 [Symbiodinium sp. KB8]
MPSRDKGFADAPNPSLEISEHEGSDSESSDGQAEKSRCCPSKQKLIFPVGVALLLGVVLALIVWLITQQQGGSKCRGFEKCPEYPLPYAFGTWPKTYNYTGRFPDGFVWGVGTASYQVEGAYREGGRGVSIWDTFTGANTIDMPGGNCSYCCKSTPCTPNEHMVDKGATGNVATNSYHMFRTDIALMKSMGLKHYRFSIAWPRIFPTGSATGEPNAEGVRWYNTFLDELLAAGIQPYVTLYHWDLPQALLSPPELSGWWARDKDGKPVGQILPNWKHYVDTCFRSFGDKVKVWVTFNEPWTSTKLASGSGKAPSIAPFMNASLDPYIAAHNMLNAHAAAVEIYRGKYQKSQGGIIGITNNQDWREPKTDSLEDIAAAERAILFQLGWFSEPIFGAYGDYPPEMRAVFGDNLPKFTDAEKKLLKGSADFFGLNHYSTGWYAATEEPGWDMTYGVSSEDGFIRAQSTWLYGAGWGLRKLLNWVKRRYNPVIYVTENGWSIGAKTAEQAANDTSRVMYYANYTTEVLSAIRQDGVDVRGYFAWSLLDNFEWEMGYPIRFGTAYVDYNPGLDSDAPLPNTHVPTAGFQLRRRKDSSCYLEQVWRENMMMPPNGVASCVQPGIFQGRYRDVTQPGCQRLVDVYVPPTSGKISGTRPGPGRTSCDNVTDITYGPASVTISGSTVVCRGCRSGSSQGFWSAGSLGIEWDDGALWQKVI